MTLKEKAYKREGEKREREVTVTLGVVAVLQIVRLVAYLNFPLG